MKVRLYLTKASALPPVYASLDIWLDEGASSGGARTTICRRCERSYGEHDWVVLAYPGGEEVQTDCSWDPRTA